jgi:flagellar biosynthesis/type III secretory pathway chaperone
MDVVTLLQSRNRCLQRFLKITKEFRASVENDDFSGLDLFLSRRDAILKTLELYDRKITATVNEFKLQTPLEARQTVVERSRAILDARELLIEEILRDDQEIMRKLDSEKLRLSNETGATRKIKNNLSKFKSAWVAPGGEELDKTL